MIRPITILLALLFFSQCHYERYVVRGRADGSTLRKHSLLTSRDTPRKLDIEFAEAEPPAAPTLATIPLVSFPRHYSGHATVTAEEEGFVANLIFTADNERNDSLLVTGSYSVDNKRTFNELTVSLPMDLFATSDPRRLDRAVSFVNNFSVAVVGVDTLREGPQGEPLDTPLVVFDTLSGLDILTTDSTLLAYDITVHENTEWGSMLSGSLSYAGTTLSFQSQSDPLPLIPMLVGAAVSYGAYKVKEYVAERKQQQAATQRRRERERERLVALARMNERK